VKTAVPKPTETERKWYVVDATDQVLGRMASQVAMILRGKHKPQFSPHLDHGDHVVVINAEKIKVTGRKLDQKSYTRYTGYPGGLRTVVLQTLQKKKPEAIIVNAVKGMLPRNPLGRAMFKKLKVYAGTEHPHAAQQPQVLNV